MHQPLLSLIIAVYNKPDFLEKIFASIGNQTFRNFEVIIADDGSTTDIARVIEKWRAQLGLPVIHVWHDDQGFRKTIIANEAVASARSDYLVFIDGDCILHHRFLERHYLHRKYGWVLAGRRVMLSETLSGRTTLDDVASKKIEKPSFWWHHCERKQRGHGIYIPFSFAIENRLQKRYWITGSNFSMYKSDFASINGYDENIVGRGAEDLNLTARLRLKGITIKKITREALQYHLFHRSDPVPHSSEAYQHFCNPVDSWAQLGLTGHQKR